MLTGRFCERAEKVIGKDFTSNKFWDKFLEIEALTASRTGVYTYIFELFNRILKTPLKEISKFNDKYKQYANNRPGPELVGPEKFNEMLQTIKKELPNDRTVKSKTDDEIRLMVKKSILEEQQNLYLQTEADTRKRWFFEEGIKMRNYFHYPPLEPNLLAAWHRYLDFEEKEGDLERLELLYRRCLVPCVSNFFIKAYYEEFWERFLKFYCKMNEVTKAKVLLEEAEKIIPKT